MNSLKATLAIEGVITNIAGEITPDRNLQYSPSILIVRYAIASAAPNKSLPNQQAKSAKKAETFTRESCLALRQSHSSVQ